MNMAPTRTNMKWLQEEGFKKFFDPGGFKIGIPGTQYKTHLFKNAGILGLALRASLGCSWGI